MGLAQPTDRRLLSGAMPIVPRYAVYYLPQPASALARFGAEILGYDAVTGCDVPFPAAVRATADWRDVTEEPRKYGFHATLKAPFALAPGRSEAELLWAAATFAETPRALPVIVPAIRAIGHFVALVPDAPSEPLTTLAADCVRDFDGFRAAMTQRDRARRKPERLTPRQLDYLDRWGYPYVMDEFRFHMTFTGSLQPKRRETVACTLRGCLAELAFHEMTIDRFAVLRQSSPEQRFRCLAQFALRGQPGQSSCRFVMPGQE
jgi:putative phosphonate metabolism protein